MLASLAHAVAGALRTEDLFARYGGEEFSILCRGVTLENASILAQRLRALVESSVFEFQGQRIPITVSIGIASSSNEPDAATRLIASADAALYDAKRNGRNRVVARSPGA